VAVPPSGRAARITSILHAGAYTVALGAPEGGTATISWFQVPPGAHVATKKHKPRPLLVASGVLRFAAAGPGKVKVRLTTAGRKLLKHSRRITLTAKASFTPSGQPTVSTTKRFTLGHG